VPEHRRRALDHRRGRGRDPRIPVPSKGRAGLHPLRQNGPEFIARAIKQWLEVCGIRTLYIEPGSPWENAYSETFISRFGDELLKREVFADLLEAKVLVEDYRDHYNHHRPHSALGYRTPAEFALAADLDTKVKDAGKLEELESVLTLS
jgi:transposase InsO family protein